MSTLRPGNYRTGRVVEYKGAYVFIPNNLGKNAKATIINPGQDSFSTMCNTLYKSLIQQGTDHIVVIPKYSGIYSETVMDQKYNTCMKYINQICRDHNATLISLDTTGSSAGDKLALKDFSHACRDGIDNGYCIITGASTINGAYQEGQKYTNGPNWAFLSDKEYSYMKGRTVYIFESKNAEKYSYVQALVKHGINVVLVECKAAGHSSLTYNPINDNIFDLLDGNPEIFLKKDNYSFWKCVDPNKMVWVKMSNDEVREVSSSNYLEVLKEQCSELSEFADRFKSGTNDTLASNLAFVSQSMSEIQGKITAHNDINYTKGSDNEAGVIGAIYSSANYYGAVTNELYKNLTNEANAVYAIANAIYKMDGCAAVIGETTLTDGMRGMFSSSSLSTDVDRLKLATSDLYNNAKKAATAGGRYDALSSILGTPVAEGSVGKISITALESAVNAVVPSLNSEVEKAIGLKGSVDSFMSGIGASNILQGGAWEDVKANMASYQNLLNCNVQAAQFISDTIKTAMGIIVDYMGEDTELDDTKLPELRKQLEELNQKIEEMNAELTRMKSCTKPGETHTTTDPETGNPKTYTDPDVPCYSSSEISSYESQIKVQETQKLELEKDIKKLEGLAPIVEKAQGIINDAISQVKNMYENPVKDVNGNESFVANFKLDLSAYGIDTSKDYKKIIDDYYDKLNPKPVETPADETPADEESGDPDDYTGGPGGPSGPSTPEVQTETVTEVPSEAPTEAPTEEVTEVPTEEPTETPTEEPTGVPTEAPTETPTVVPTEAPASKPPKRHGGGGINKKPGTEIKPTEPEMIETEPMTEMETIPEEPIIEDYEEEFYSEPEIIEEIEPKEIEEAQHKRKNGINVMGIASGIGLTIGATALGAHAIVKGREKEEDDESSYGYDK